MGVTKPVDHFGEHKVADCRLPKDDESGLDRRAIQARANLHETNAT